MNIISHRGFWREPSEKNTIAAFRRTVADGYGTETDVRDLAGRLVVSHDPPTGGEILWSDLLDIFAGSGLLLAVNIKADGLSAMVATAFEGRGIPWFAFDMSVPEMIRFRRAGLRYYTRHSDVEPSPNLYDNAAGVWLDAFDDGAWFGESDIRAHLDAGKEVCVVSPELHGRDHAAVWALLKHGGAHPALTLCTDIPDQAREYFKS